MTTPLLELQDICKDFGRDRGRRGRKTAAAAGDTAGGSVTAAGASPGAPPAPERSGFAVDGVSLTVEPGETLAIVGESGSGKTTVAKIVMGLVAPTSGRVIVTGQDVTGLVGRERMAWRRHVQMVFQDPYASLDPRQSVESAIREPMEIYHIGTRAEQDRRVGELMDDVTLPKRCRRMLPHELSGGLRQRVAIASALASAPSLIVADEPVSALDVSVQAEIIELLIRVQEETQVGIVFITHDLGVVKEIGDRAVVMKQGHIVETGTVEQVFTAPQQEYTRDLLAAVLPIDVG